uniref:5'-nucleotidase n=1 Tax=Heterorhabditis bacteriophora TaxID=37862 RepID=A0A1I7WTR9_HETBA
MRTSSLLLSPVTINAPVEISHISTQNTFIPLTADENNETVGEMTNSLNAILNHPQLVMKDRASVEMKLKKIISGGPDKLMVISDFDYTLSRSEDSDGKKCWTTHGVFDNGADSVYPGLGEKFKALKNKYYPIEFDPTLSMEEKTPYMEKWWSTSHNYIVEAGFNRSTIENFVRNSKITLRDQTEPWMLKLRDLGVPLVVFSAGIGNVIEIFFKQKFEKILTNIHIISNMMLFNNQVCSIQSANHSNKALSLKNTYFF